MKEVIVRIDDYSFRCGFIPDDLEINRNIKDMQYCLEEINKLIIKDTNELYIRELLNRIDKATQFLNEWEGKFYRNSLSEDKENMCKLLKILRGEQ